MSAIAGIVNLNGAPVDQDLLNCMDEAGSRFGPDVQGQWREDYVGFAYRGVSASQADHPEQPLLDPDTGLLVVLDGFIHGKKELRKLCEAAGHASKTPHDSELVLRAYQIWGENCPKFLLGEYAFALWDPGKRRLLCARDTAGIRPLFYAPTPHSIRFATGANQLMADTSLPRVLDVTGMLDIILNGGTALPDRTPNASIQRLPAAHILLADSRGIRVQRYWSLDDDLNERPLPLEEYPEACAESLQEALRDRLEGHSQVGLGLSGGWDSGSLFSFWQWLRSRGEPIATPWILNLYTGGYPEADERREVQDLLRRWPAQAEFLNLSPGQVLTGLAKHTRQLGMPEPWISWFGERQCGVTARQAGIRLILSGEGGNFVLQSSYLRLIDLLRGGNLAQIGSQMKIWRQEYYWSTNKLFLDVLIAALAIWNPALWSLARRLRALLLGNKYSTCLAPSLEETAMELTERVRKEVKYPVRGGKFSLRDKRFWLEHLYREMFPVGQALNLEGVVMSAPYLDRRVAKVGLSWIAREEEASSSRELLGRALERSVGYRLPPSYGRAAPFFRDVIQKEINKGDNLLQMRTLMEYGIIDPKRLRRLLERCAAGQGRWLLEVWPLASMEAWAQDWLGNN